MGTRRKGREAALQILYQIDMTGADPETALALYWRELAPSQEGQAFAGQLVLGCVGESEALDATIRGVSQHWRLERMDRVDRNILRLGTYELLRLPEVPKRVTLNESVELAKRFGSEGSAAFINGVLDRIATSVDKA